MSDTVPISLLVPSYNPGAYFEKAIASVADQLVPGDEVVVQDGGSTDGSLDALTARYAGAPWLKIVSEPDRGQADALQRALLRAQNAYIMWLNGDDIVYPGGLAAIRRGLATSPDLVIGRSTIFQNSGRVVRTYTPRPLTRRAMVGRGNDMFTGSVAYRAALVRDVGGFDARYQYCMDMDVIARIAEREPSIVYIPEVIAGLRWHAESKGGSTLWPIVREAAQVRLEHARTRRERTLAIAVSGVYLVAGTLQPVRHSRLYSGIRAAVRRRATVVGADPG